MKRAAQAIRFVMVSAIVLCGLGCAEPSAKRKEPTMSPEEAIATAAALMAQFTGWEEPLLPDPAAYEVESAGDLDGDGLYEVSFRQNVEGSMGWISGFIFTLERKGLRYRKDLRMLQRATGETTLKSGAAIVRYRAWLPTDAHCCPSLSVNDRLGWQERRGLQLLRSDTARAQAN